LVRCLDELDVELQCDNADPEGRAGIEGASIEIGAFDHQVGSLGGVAEGSELRPEPALVE
jgi:hypothetical protein